MKHLIALLSDVKSVFPKKEINILVSTVYNEKDSFGVISKPKDMDYILR